MIWRCYEAVTGLDPSLILPNCSLTCFWSINNHMLTILAENCYFSLLDQLNTLYSKCIGINRRVTGQVLIRFPVLSVLPPRWDTLQVPQSEVEGAQTCNGVGRLLTQH